MCNHVAADHSAHGGRGQYFRCTWLGRRNLIDLRRRAGRTGWADRQTAVEQTRERIVAATFELHATIGPSRTTISAIADRADLERHTVYAHFPYLESLYEACTVHGIRLAGMPEPDGWREVDGPPGRLRHGLTEIIAMVPGEPADARQRPFRRRPGGPATDERRTPSWCGWSRYATR